jgi:hypothetical protein
VFSFSVRHTVALAISIVVPPITYLILFFIWFFYQAATNQDLGSPMINFLLFGAVSAVSITYSLVFLFPSVALSEYISRFFGKWRHLVQVPIATLNMGVMVVLAHLAFSMFSISRQATVFSVLNHPIAVLAALLLPLGLYWWSMKFVQAGMLVPEYCYKWLGNHLLKSQATIPESLANVTANEEKAKGV